MDRKTVKAVVSGQLSVVRSVILILFFLLLLTACAAPLLGKKPSDTEVDKTSLFSEKSAGRKPPGSLPVNRPQQVSFESDPVLYAALSGDGRYLAYVLEQPDASSLWLTPRDPGVAELPQKLFESAGRITAPALSPDGRNIAFVAEDQDAKGDIYWMSIDTPRTAPRRLTGRESTDGAPAFSPNSQKIYFHRSFPGDRFPHIAVLNLPKGESESPEKPQRVLHAEAGGFPAVSPNGELLAFVSFKEDAGGDMGLVDLKTGDFTPISKGPALDLYPAWSPDGKWLYFSRFDRDTNRDGRINPDDNPIVVRTPLSGPRKGTLFPLTSGYFPAYGPMPAASEMLFLSKLKGTVNLWALPLEGEIPALADPPSQMALAELLADRIPPENLRAVLAYERLLEIFPEERALGAKACYDMGRLYDRMDQSGKAAASFRRVINEFDDIMPEKTLAAIALVSLETEKKIPQAPTDFERRKILTASLLKIDAIVQKNMATTGMNKANAARLKARALITKALLLANMGRDPDAVQKAIDFLDKAIQLEGLSDILKAEALYHKAHINRRLSRANVLAPAYLAIITTYTETPWADRAVLDLIDLYLSDPSLTDTESRMEALSGLARKYQDMTPLLAMGACNRNGDLAFEAGDWPQAKRWYRTTLNLQKKITSKNRSSKGETPPRQVAAARLALAEILYREEQFRQALDLYETEMADRPCEDHLYELARTAHVRKSMAAADYLFHLGEIPAARTLYADLIRENDGLVQAHRGYIKCAAAMKEIPQTLAAYEEQLKKDPNNPVWLYTTGLGLTYLENQKSLNKARTLIEKAIRRQGQVPYYHQTLGYIFEVLETVYGETGGLEKALLSYRKALYLNDSDADPENEANLALNLGHIHFLLGQYAGALKRYDDRLTSKVPFDNTDTEILFYRRLGRSAFQVDDPAKAIEAFQKSLALIDGQMNPKRASEQMGKINRYVFDRILTPALARSKNAPDVKALALRQSDISKALFHATGERFGPPPNHGWNRYQKAMTRIMDMEAKLIEDLAPLVTENRDQTLQTLSFMQNRARESLACPDRMIELKAEMLDRLGLACQAAGHWAEARKAFEKAFLLNQGLARTWNLAVNRRSSAYSIYMAAEKYSGKEKKGLLKEALAQFQEAIDLLSRYGVASPKGKKKKTTAREQGGALLNVSLDLTLDQTAGTQAAYGFTKDQEKRLALAFISRIETELGTLSGAQKAVQTQLAPYLKGNVPAKDLYGVSLLFHRDGQLQFAMDRPKEALIAFSRSAEMALALKNAISASINGINMAWALQKIPANDPEYIHFEKQLENLDRRISRLLNQSLAVLDPLVGPAYHNQMGVLTLKPAPPKNFSLNQAVNHMTRMKRATGHFATGLKILEEIYSKNALKPDRNALALKAALHLNLAQLALRLGEPDEAKKSAGKALEASKTGLLPRYTWRALVVLGRLKQALAILENVPLMGAGCGPFEIINDFSPMVSSLIRDDKPEAALNLLERLSEIERFQRQAPMLPARISKPEKEVLTGAYSRFLRISRLTDQLKGAQKEDRRHLEERILQEKTLLLKTLGPVPDRFEAAPTLTRSQPVQELVLFLLSIGLEMEKAADQAVSMIAPEEREKALTRYRDCVKQYARTWKKLRQTAAREGTPGVAALFGPIPMEAIDLMENLPPNGTALRFFTGFDDKWTVFKITRDDISVETLPLNDPLPNFQKDETILIYEDPTALPDKATNPVALSITHLVRSVNNRKPFKRRILEVAGNYRLPRDFKWSALPETASKEDILTALPGVQGLLAAGPVHEAGTVPTRPGEVPVYGPVMTLDQGRSLPLLDLFAHVSDVSLVAMPRSSLKNAYMPGHLFSLMGVPTLLIPRHAENPSPFVGPFFDAYLNLPVHDALVETLSKDPPKKTMWTALGYRGMTDKEAFNLAGRRFRTYVKEGIAAFKQKEPAHALVQFEKALSVARQVKKLSRYKPQLLVYARESAYGAGRYETAARYAGELARYLKQKKPDSKDHAEALLKLGLIQAKLEKYDQAIGILEEGAEMMALLELEDLQVQALNDLGVVLENATRYDQALNRFQSAAELSATLNRQESLARQHMRMGRVYDLRMNQYAKAKTHYLKAFKHYENLKQEENMAQALLDAGRCDRLMGNFEGAADQYEQALDLLSKSGDALKDTRTLAGILMEQANNQWFQAQYQSAFKGQRRVYQMAKKNRWILEQVNAKNTAGLIWWTLGDHESALRQLEDALDLAKTLKTRQDETATTLNNMGLVYRDAGDYEKALNALQQALRIDRKINSRWAMAYDLKNLALTRLRMKAPSKAISLFEEALTLAQQIGNKINEAKIRVGYGEALMAAEKFEEAKDQFEQALSLSKKMVLKEVEWRALYGLGQLALEAGNREAALKRLQAAVNVIEAMRAHIKLDQMKDGFITNKMSVYETLVTLLVNMGRDSDAFYAAERSRARNLIDLLGNQRLTLHEAVDQKRYTLDKHLKTQMAEYEMLMAQAKTEDERILYERAFNRAKDQHRDLMLEIQMDNPELASLLSVDPLTLSQVQSLLEPDTALLVYYVVPHEIYCWLISRNSVELFRTPLGRETLAQTVLDYRRTLQNLEPPETEAQTLYNWLLKPMGDRLNQFKTLGIVPHHVLHHLSFPALYDGKAYVVDRFPLFSLPSASVLRYAKGNRHQGQASKVLAVGNPDLDNPSLDLPFAEKEVASIGWNFPEVTTLTGKKATERWVSQHIQDYSIIHLASHGDFDPVNPLFSSVKLAKDEKDDGNLRASEVFGLDIRADLVMLSACQTGLGKITRGDEVIGMNRAFLYAGTNAILSSLWRVSDISTALLVKQFYRDYKNHTKAESLNRAMRHVKTRYPHPGYWGAFVLVGDYR